LLPNQVAAVLLGCWCIAAHAEKSDDIAPSNCILKTSSGKPDFEDDKACFSCAFACLTNKDCATMEWEGSPKVPVHHLANFTCPDTPVSEEGDTLCVLLSDKNKVLDASVSTCDACIDYCENVDECATMGFNYTLVERDALSTWTCPEWVPPPKEEDNEEEDEEEDEDAFGLGGSKNTTKIWMDTPKKTYSPFPTPSPVPTSPAPPRECQVFSAKAYRIDNNPKNCLECQSQCLGDDACAYAILNGTAGNEGLSLNRTTLATYKCEGWKYAGNATHEYKCTITTTEGLVKEAGDKTCSNCTKHCVMDSDCASMIFNHDEFPYEGLSQEYECPFGQMEGVEDDLPIAGRKLK
jgi:hypothetical protein